jgi:hypothetical protein
MKALSIEKSILEGELEIKDLFQFVLENAEHDSAYEMEKAIFLKVMSIGKSAMKCYFAKRGTGDIGATLDVNQKIFDRSNTLSIRNYFSVFGKINVPRTCYYKKDLNWIMPLDALVDFPERCYSYLLQDWMSVLSLRDSYKESEITLFKLLGVNVKASRFDVVNRESSSSYNKFYEEKAQPDVTSEGEIQVLQFDGKGVPMIKKELSQLIGRLGKGEKRQKKKEAMVGVSYTVNKKERTAEEVATNLIYPERAKKEREQNKKNNKQAPNQVKAKNIRRLASIEKSKQEVVETLFEDGKKRNKENKKPWLVVMDGARGLWSLISKVLRGIDYVGILDIIHVVEYLWLAGNALHGERSNEGKKWVYNQLLTILQCRVGRVIGSLKQIMKKRKLSKTQQKAINTTIKYFENHREWMKYDVYLKEGYPIGTGVVESTCGHTVKDRMEGSGRRWSVIGAESVLLLRSVYTSGDWEDYWQTHIKQSRERLYGDLLKTLSRCDDYQRSIGICDDYSDNNSNKKAA